MREVEGIYLAENAVVTGDVVAGPGVNVWFGCVVRADLARITLGAFANIQDGCVLHTDWDAPLDVGPGVVAGHMAMLHGRSVGADTLVGIGAKLLAGSVVGPECVIAAGSVVTEGKHVPPRSVVMGVPARVVREVTPEEVERTRATARRYAELARRYAAGGVARPFGPDPQDEPRKPA
jgi:carbonic anhydrase/acetyltransferase-like protein (isoleucine patch superfamily)